MTVSNVYGPTVICVGANIEEQDKFICDLAKVTTAHRASTQFYITNDFNSKLSIHHQLKKLHGHRNANGSDSVYFRHA